MLLELAAGGAAVLAFGGALRFCAWHDRQAALEDKISGLAERARSGDLAAVLEFLGPDGYEHTAAAYQRTWVRNAITTCDWNPDVIYAMADASWPVQVAEAALAASLTSADVEALHGTVPDRDSLLALAALQPPAPVEVVSS